MGAPYYIRHFFIVFVLPKIPEIRTQTVESRAKEIATENAKSCKRLGLKAGTGNYNECLLDLGELRLKIENRLVKESDF